MYPKGPKAAKTPCPDGLNQGTIKWAAGGAARPGFECVIHAIFFFVFKITEKRMLYPIWPGK